jgi:hypothetical protein
MAALPLLRNIVTRGDKTGQALFGLRNCLTRRALISQSLGKARKA